MTYFDCFLREPALANEVLDFGWDGGCVARGFDKDFKSFAKESSSKPNILAGALVTGDVTKNARRALDGGADLVFAVGGGDLNRLAAECWEVDVLLHPERGAEKDFMDQKNSGLDAASAKFMAERGIMLGIVLSEVLGVSGGSRVQLLGRIRQNLTLAAKYSVRVVYCSGAGDVFGLRAPRDAAALLGVIGLTNPEKAVAENPALLFRKAADRRDPNVLTKGLKVLSWGDDGPPQTKKKYGRL